MRALWCCGGGVGVGGWRGLNRGGGGGFVRGYGDGRGSLRGYTEGLEWVGGGWR